LRCCCCAAAAVVDRTIAMQGSCGIVPLGIAICSASSLCFYILVMAMPARGIINSCTLQYFWQIAVRRRTLTFPLRGRHDHFDRFGVHHGGRPLRRRRGRKTLAKSPEPQGVAARENARRSPSKALQRFSAPSTSFLLSPFRRPSRGLKKRMWFPRVGTGLGVAI
jgi:hypothetical protein